MAVLKDSNSPFIVPADEDPLEEVGIATGGQIRKKIPRHQFAAVSDALRFERGSGCGNDMRSLEENAAQGRIGLQDRPQQRAAPSTDVDDEAQSREIIDRGYRQGFLTSRDIHERLKRVGGIAMPQEIGVKLHAEDVVKGRIPGLDAIE